MPSRKLTLSLAGGLALSLGALAAHAADVNGYGATGAPPAG